MESLFPHHPCVLARTPNPFRCGNLDEPSRDRCAVCRLAMRSEAWQALFEGDKSLAEFLLADDLLVEHGFSVSKARSTVSRFPALALLRAKSSEFSKPGDCIIEPEENGVFRLAIVLKNGERAGVECSNLTEAWLIFRPYERVLDSGGGSELF